MRVLVIVGESITQKIARMSVGTMLKRDGRWWQIQSAKPHASLPEVYVTAKSRDQERFFSFKIEQI